MLRWRVDWIGLPGVGFVAPLDSQSRPSRSDACMRQSNRYRIESCGAFCAHRVNLYDQHTDRSIRSHNPTTEQPTPGAVSRVQPAAAAAAAPVAPVQAAAPQTTQPGAAAPQQTGDGIGGAHPIRLSLSERARTVTYVATAATLGTFSPDGPAGAAEATAEAGGTPFGSYVDYILDDKVGRRGGWEWGTWLNEGSAEWSRLTSLCFVFFVFGIHIQQGWPVLLLSEQSLHTQNIKANPRVSLFVQMPRQGKESTVRAARRARHCSMLTPIYHE